MFLFLPAEKHFKVFDSSEHEHDKGANRTQDKQAFEDSDQHRDDRQTHRHLCYLKQGEVDNVKRETKRRQSETGMVAAREREFAMLLCATNLLQRLATGHGVSRAADCHFSPPGSLLAVVDRGGAFAVGDSAGAQNPRRCTWTVRSVCCPPLPGRVSCWAMSAGFFGLLEVSTGFSTPCGCYGGLPIPAAVLVLILFCIYIGLYHGLFGLLLALVARSRSAGSAPGDSGVSIRRALAAAPFLWVAVELARSRTSPVPWELLGYSQTANFGLTRIATFTGVYGLSFEIALVNSVFAAALLAPKERRKWLLAAACGAAVILQAGQWLTPPTVTADRSAILVQPNIPIQDGGAWTKEYFQNTLRDLAATSLHPAGEPAVETDDRRYDVIVWPESPSPFYTNDPLFRDAVSDLARQSRTWVVAGAIGINPATHNGGEASQIFNSAALVNPQGEWVGRYDKVHLVPFGEYLPFPGLFAFAGGLTKEVGEFQRGRSRIPLEAGNERFGLFICYESIFPDEVRQFPLEGAQVLVNISNDGWYGDSGAWKEHLRETRMRAIENGRWLLLATNTGITRIDRSLWTDRGVYAAQGPHSIGGAVCTRDGYHFLHAAWRLVRVSVCDNFSRRAAGALCYS